MIVLDTTIVSELMKQGPDDTVVRWVDRYPANEVFITSVTAAELAYGVARLPDGRRKAALAAKVSDLLSEDLKDQILQFDNLAAGYYGAIVAEREAQGRPISMANAQIAAICRCFAAGLATRNSQDFVGIGVMLLNPWDDAPEANETPVHSGRPLRTQATR